MECIYQQSQSECIKIVGYNLAKFSNLIRVNHYIRFQFDLFILLKINIGITLNMCVFLAIWYCSRSPWRVLIIEYV